MMLQLVLMISFILNEINLMLLLAHLFLVHKRSIRNKKITFNQINLNFVKFLKKG